MNHQHRRKGDRDFIRVVQLASAFSLGTMFGFLYSVKEVTPKLRYELSMGTVVAFALAAVFSWMLWNALFEIDDQERADSSRAGKGSVVRSKAFRVAAGLIGLFILGMVGAFGYALKDVSRERFREVAGGTVMALLFLSVVGFLLWRVVRLFEDQDKQSLNGHDDPPDTK